jgi:hypothetical protein
VTTGLLVILFVGAAAAGWALLSVMGAERQRLLSELDARRPRPQPGTTQSAAAAPPQAPSPPAGKTPRRNAR